MPDAPAWLREAFAEGADQLAHDNRPLMGYMPFAGAAPTCFLANFDPAKIPCGGQRIERVHLIPRQRVRNAVYAVLPALPCCAVDGDLDDPYGVCELPEGHDTRWHRETRDGQVWAEWSGPRPPTTIQTAEWDPRNSELGCELHHRRFDSHAVSSRAPKIVVPAFHLPEHADEFILDLGLEPEAERRFEGYRPDGDRAYLWRPGRR